MRDEWFQHVSGSAPNSLLLANMVVVALVASEDVMTINAPLQRAWWPRKAQAISDGP